MKNRFLPIFLLLAIYAITFTRHLNAGGGGWATSQGYYQVSKVCRDGYLFSRASSALGVASYNTVKNFAVNATGPITEPLHSDWLDEDGIIIEDELILEGHYYSSLGPTAAIRDDQIVEVENFEILGNTADKYLAQDVMGYFYGPLEVGDQVLLNRFVLPVENCFLAATDGSQAATIQKERLEATNTRFPDNDLIYTVLELPTNGLSNEKSSLAVGAKISLAEIANAGLSYTPTSEQNNDVEYFRYSLQGTTRVSVRSDGGQAFGGDSFEPSISANGSKIVFTTEATNLASAVFDDNGVSDVILRSQQFINETTFISSRKNNVGSTGRSYYPQISPDGENIAFVSAGEHLLTNESQCTSKLDDNNVRDIFLYRSGATSRLSMFEVSGTPCQQLSQRSIHPSIADLKSGSGNVVFQTYEPLELPFYDDENNAADLLLNRGALGPANVDNELIYGVNNLAIAPTPGSTPTLNAPNARSVQPHISADGNVIALHSDATNLIKTISGQDGDTNGFSDVYASHWNGEKWVISRISVTSSGAQATGGHSQNGSPSQFGQHIVFESFATNFDKRASGQSQIYVRDREASCTTLLSVNSSGEVGDRHSQNASISANGRFVAFESAATNLIRQDTNLASDIFVVDRDADGDNSFYVDAENCVAGPSRTFRVSVASDGTQANGPSSEPDISDNGAFVAFASDATNLVENDTNGLKDVFVHYIGFEGKIRFEANSQKQIFLPFIIR